MNTSAPLNWSLQELGRCFKR